jgi:uncharacterized phage infection (PIP) family protein YhgE
MWKRLCAAWSALWTSPAVAAVEQAAGEAVTEVESVAKDAASAVEQGLGEVADAARSLGARTIHDVLNDIDSVTADLNGLLASRDDISGRIAAGKSKVAELINEYATMQAYIAAKLKAFQDIA